MSSLLRSVILVAVANETLLHKDRILEMEAGFLVLLWQSRIFHLDFKPEGIVISSDVKHSFKAAIICDLRWQNASDEEQL